MATSGSFLWHPNGHHVTRGCQAAQPPSLPLRHAYNSHNICLPALLLAPKAGQKPAGVCNPLSALHRLGKRRRFRKDERTQRRGPTGGAGQGRGRSHRLHCKARGTEYKGRHRCQFRWKKGKREERTRRRRTGRHKGISEPAPSRAAPRASPQPDGGD